MYMKEVQLNYDEVQDYMDWTKTKSELKFNPPKHTFPIIPNCIYWAYMGCNIGSVNI